MRNIYNDGTYLQNNPNWHDEDAPFKATKITTLLQKNALSPETVAEIGCGSGEILVQLSTLLPTVRSFKGYDISQDAIALAKNKENERIHFEVKDLSEEKENAQVDLLLVIDVIEHIEDYFRFLRGLRGKSSYIVFHIPLDLCIWTLFREQMLIESKERVGHIHNFTEKFVLSILKDQGFEVADHFFTEPTYTPKTTKERIVRFLRKTIYRINKRMATKTLGGYSIMVLVKNPE
jgi:predicted TPR repeat methyltransferase